MEWLNYHHLLYFWTVAKEGSLAGAAKVLRVSQPTLSTQIRALEAQLEVALFDRSGRRLRLTDVGVVAFRYADEMFSLGRELLDVVRGRPVGRPLRLAVGLTFTVPKLVAYRLLEPALVLPGEIELEVHEGRLAELVPQLWAHELDLVISDAPLVADVGVKAPGARRGDGVGSPRGKAFNHPLGESHVVFFAADALARRLRPGFPRSLDRAPFLMPMRGTPLRRELERWLDRHGLEPQTRGLFDDTALVKVFGQSGIGVFVGPAVIEQEIRAQYGVAVVGRSDEIIERFYAISMERRIKHAGVIAISSAARQDLFERRRQ
jgi:LysR family transcriptional regulator, transcriptional activator of nhaA